MSAPIDYRHVLPGLRPEPLASYLAGLGLIRVLGEQADPAATAVWTGEGLVISTAVTDLAGWLAGEYVPTPVLSPWNNGSGFGLKDKEPKRTLETLRTHPSPRLARLRAAIPVAEEVSQKARAAGWLADGGKGRVVQEFRNTCPDELLPWIDASVVLAGEDVMFPPLLGTGGNDGRLDFSTNFHQRLLEVLDNSAAGQASSLAWAGDLLAGTQTQPLADAAVGQFDLAAAGGPGSSPFGAAASRVNPWGYVLLVEGALLFAASAARRNEHGAGRAAIPFTVRASPDGSDTGAPGEESRGEIWVPVWTQPFTVTEIRQLFTEARASWRGHPARRAAQFYAAARTLGVARGVDSFVRYGLHQRNGLAFAAVPLDHIDVRENTGVRLLASVEDWPARLRADLPGRIQSAVRQFEAAQLEYARSGEPGGLAQMLAALTALEQAVGHSSRARVDVPVRRLPDAQPFLQVLALDATPELRVAVGIASCATLPGPETARAPGRTMRQILLPLDPPGPADQARSPGRWRVTPLVAGFGARPLAQILSDVMAWRSRTAADEPRRHNENFRGVPTFRRGIPVPATDLHAFACRDFDEGRLELLLLACLALDWHRTRWTWPSPGPVGIPIPTLGLLQPLAACLPLGSADDPVRLCLRTDWANRLTAGQVGAVHDEAVARLRQAGWLAVPSPRRSTAAQAAADRSGTLIAAALVPRCSSSRAALRLLASPPRDDGNGHGAPAHAPAEEDIPVPAS